MRYVFLGMLFFVGFTAYGQSAFAKAEKLYRNKQYEKALVAFEKLYEQDKNNLDVIERIGDIAGHRKDFKTAMSYYKVLVEEKPNDAHYNFKYGGSMGLYAKGASKFKALGMLDDIKYYLKKAAKLDPNHIESRHALSQLYCELPGIVGGSISKSRSYADDLLKISPVDGHLAHGFIDEYEEDYEAAINSYTKAVETGGSLLTYRRLAAVYADKLDQKSMALDVLREAAKTHGEASLKKEIEQLESELAVGD
ncbi:tetratricopeptide repeat protein [Nonlabens xiamenensis]|uniref:tetratricopeptide repeat protein n=1 Tax=Nonlabens xiamenensis TaxID=2341043 RepID=UPI000F60E382|nr:hypothetical protein [Nonlabens xiamenensis]